MKNIDFSLKYLPMKGSNLNNWPVKYVSPNVSNVFGYSVDDFYSGKVVYTDMIAESDLVRVTEEVVNASNAGLNSFDHEPYQIIHQDGTIRWLYDHTVIIRNECNEISHFYGYVFDITHHKITEIALNTSEIWSKSILDHTEAIVYAKNLNGYFLQINHSFEKIFNVQSNNIIGQTDHDIFPQEQADIFRVNDLKVLKFNKKIELEELVTQNNELHTYISQKFPLYDDKGKVYGVCGISLDITERKKMEQELLSSRDQYKKTELLLQKTRDNLQLTLKNKENNLLYLSQEIQTAVEQRIKTEKRLHESTLRYQSLFESSPVALWDEDFTQLYAYFDQLRKIGINDFRTFFNQNPKELIKCIEKVKVLNVNQSALTLYEAKNKKVFLDGLNDVFTENSLTVYREEIIAFANGQTGFKSEAVVKTFSGQILTILLKIKIEKKSSGHVIALFATPNITEQKQAEKKLAQHQKILISVAEISNNFLNTHNWQEEVEHTLALIGKTANISRAYLFESFPGSEQHLLFRQRYEWCAKGVTAQISNNELQSLDFFKIGFSKYYKQLLNNEISICSQSDYSKVQRDHLEPQNILTMLLVPLFIDNALWGFIGFDDCINERIWNKVEIAALKFCAGVISGALHREQSEQALRASEQRFRSLVESTNDMIWEMDPNGIYTYISPSIEGMLGYKSEDIIGKTPFDLMPENEAKHIKSIFSDISSNWMPFVGLENVNLHKDGHLVNLETNGRPIFDSLGKYIGYRGIDRDISERKQAESIRNIQAEKQRVLLVQEVHHRIKNHLQGLIGLLKQHRKAGPQYDTIIDEMIAQIDSIAIVYGLQSSSPESQILFLQMVQAIVKSLASLTQLTLSLTHGEKLRTFEIDSDKAVALALVVNELIMNAIKHFSCKNDKGQIIIHFDYGSNYVALSISNPGYLPEEFDFYSGKGLGTGLQLAKSMLPMHGAEFLVEEKGGIVIARLVISSPLLINM